MTNGRSDRYVRLYVKTADNPIWTVLSPAVFKVFVACIWKANYKDGSWYDGSRQITVKRGSFITSISQLAEFTRLSVQQVRDSISHMKKLEIVTCEGTSRWTRVTVLNYELYNSSYSDQEQAEERAGEQGRNKVGTRSEQAENMQENNSLRSLNTVELLEETHTAAVAAEPVPEPKLKRVPKEPTELEIRTAAMGLRMHDRHDPAHRVAPAVATQKLRSIAKLFGAVEVFHELEEIERRHIGWCQSIAWTKDGGQYCKGLKAWLNPVDRLWANEPPIESGVLPFARMSVSQVSEERRKQHLAARIGGMIADAKINNA